jgi:hypothetical protein
MYYSYWIGVLFMITLASLSAEEGHVSMQFRTFSVTNEIKGVQCLMADDSVEIQVPSQNRSAPIKYKGSREIVFYRKEGQVPGQPINPLAKGLLREGLRNPLIVFIPRREGKTKGTPYLIKVIDDDPRDFPNGMVKFMNLTNKQLKIELGQTRKVRGALEPAEVFEYRLPDYFKGNIPVKISIAYPKKMLPLMHSRIFPNKDVRDIYFIWPIYRKTAGNHVWLTTLRERGDMAKARLNP